MYDFNNVERMQKTKSSSSWQTIKLHKQNNILTISRRFMIYLGISLKLGALNLNLVESQDWQLMLLIVN